MRPETSVRRVFRALAAAMVVACAMGAPAVAFAKADVQIANVELPEGEPAKKTKMVRRLLATAAKRAQFGKAQKVRIHATVTELEVVDQGEVVKVRCTMVGRLEGGQRARSRMEFSGRPSEKVALERKVLGMVADGLMTRLAQMARERATKEAPPPPPSSASDRR